MADIRPFRGLHYNEELLKEWSRVVCPVYDIISAQQEEELYRRSEYNFVRLEAGRELPQDTPNDNRYTRAAATLDEWLSKGILETERAPAIYLHDHYYQFGGKGYKRRGLIARVHLEDWDKMVIRPHESTLSGPKTDRLSLLWAIQANTSSVLSLYEDRGNELTTTLEVQEEAKPLMDLQVAGGEGHRVWAISDPSAVGKIAAHMAGRPLYIADGHHRYESAMNYRRQRRAATGSVEEPYDFVMMTLVELSDPGLLILPTHRLVRGIRKPVLENLRSKLGALFEIEDVRYDGVESLKRLERSSRPEDDERLVLFGLEEGTISILRLRDSAMIVSMMPQFHTDMYRKLEVSIIDHVILEKLIGLTVDKEKMSVAYSYDAADAADCVLTGEYQLAFIVKPVRPSVMKEMADLGDKMPKKSTYFYPKVPAGLMLNRVAE